MCQGVSACRQETSAFPKKHTYAHTHICTHMHIHSSVIPRPVHHPYTSSGMTTVTRGHYCHNPRLYVFSATHKRARRTPPTWTVLPRALKCLFHACGETLGLCKSCATRDRQATFGNSSTLAHPRAHSRTLAHPRAPSHTLAHTICSDGVGHGGTCRPLSSSRSRSRKRDMRSSDTTPA